MKLSQKQIDALFLIFNERTLIQHTRRVRFNTLYSLYKLELIKLVNLTESTNWYMLTDAGQAYVQFINAREALRPLTPEEIEYIDKNCEI